MLKKTVLIIVPHPDDELSIGGSLFFLLKKRGFNVKVLIVTNGDAADSGKKRLNESVKGLRILGIREKDIVFLGYGNRWRGNKHIYNQPMKEKTQSLAGYVSSYALREHKEYHYLKYSRHSLYTREHMLHDMQECIKDFYADIIVCVDFDSHPDHRAVSLMFEEVMGNILKSTSYRPLILKRFAYAFAWHGAGTPFNKKISRCRVFDQRFQLDNPYYEWSRKVVIDLRCSKAENAIRAIRMYLATLAYSSQNAKTHINQLLKKELIYWQRRTDSLLYDAEIEVSSGEKKYLTDFKRFDCNDVNCQIMTDNFWNPSAWEPETADADKAVYIKWKKPVFVSQISICASILHNSAIQDCEICWNEKHIHTGKLAPGMESFFSIDQEVAQMTLRIVKYTGVNPGISEVEVYSDENQRCLVEFESELKPANKKSRLN